MSAPNPGDAAISNPRISDEAKQRARNKPDEMDSRGEVDGAEAHAGQVARGHKAAISNQRNSQESKQHSQNLLELL